MFRELRARIASFGWSDWLPPFLQTTTLLGLALIVLVWGGVEFYLGREHDSAQASAIQNTTNLTRLFEEHIVRLIKDNDRVLRQLQLSSVNGTLESDFNRLVGYSNEAEDAPFQITTTDEFGIVTLSNSGVSRGVIDLSDREHFLVHRDSAEAGLFISKPLLARISNKWSIVLTRALRKPHGQFAGIAIALINADKLAKFYETVDLGAYGAVNLVGVDGVVRASAGMHIPNIGTSMRNTELLRNAAKTDEGWFMTPGTIDGVRRLMSFRDIDGYPLILAVGLAEKDVFGEYWRRRTTSRTVASALTLFILIVIAVNIRHGRGLSVARAKLRTSEALAQEKSRELELTLDHMSQGIMMVDGNSNVALMNRQAVKLLGLPEDMTVRRPKFDELVKYQREAAEFGPDGMAVDPEVRKFVMAGLSYPILTAYERTRPNGVVLDVRSVNLPDGGFVRTFTDISERKRNEEKIAHMAHHDALTGLANRLLLREHIEIALRRQRRHGEGSALLVIDLDHFKRVNDTLGHGAGDELLRCVAQRLQGCVRELDIVARLGGDEFAILQVAPDGRQGIEAFARRVVEVVSAPYTVDGRPATIGASIGIARAEDSPDIEQMFHNADLAVYRVKAEGRNGYRLFEPEMDETAQARRQLEDDVRRASGRGELELYYQPIFDLATGAIVNAEALLRWNHPLRGRLLPAEFMAVAEEIGVMPEIDSWVLKTACAEAVRWPEGVEIAVNLSPAKFVRRTLLDVVRRALADSRLPPQRLELEISERTLLGSDESIAVLRALRDVGVRIALDDFGTGHSSLSGLRAFRFDKIKIDQSFIAEIERREDCAVIVAAIAGLGRSLGVQTTAEGVETQAQAELVRAAGCTQAQGYLFSRPVPAAAIRTLLAENASVRRVA